MASTDLERPPLPSATTLVVGGITLIVGYVILKSVLGTLFWLLRMGILFAIVVGVLFAISKLSSDD